MAKRKRTKTSDPGSPTLATHRRARYDYEILDEVEAGIVLVGPEIKSMRAGNVTIGEGYARFADGELWLYNVYVAPYPAARENPAPTRPRKLLLHRRELDRLRQELERQPRTTLVPLRLFLSRGMAKVQLGLVRGRRSYDKREAIKQRETERAIGRAVRAAQKQDW